ncbi:hypothetical protein PAMP_016810 [Pampus punctatissimus]
MAPVTQTRPEDQPPSAESCSSNKPAEREEIKRFYVLQRAALQRHMSGERGRRTVARKRSSSRSSARCHGSLWRPW